jgi:chromosome partitioning protein
VRVATGNLKGGVAKTTTAVHLALGLARTGRTLLVDADVQQPSAFAWCDVAGDEWPAGVEVRSWATRDLARRVEMVADDYAHVVIDTGPKDGHVLRAALSVVDHLVIPLAPRPLDVREVDETLKVAAEVDDRHPLAVSVLLVQVRRGTRSAVEARTYLEGDRQLPVLAAEVRLSEAVALAFGSAPEDLGDYEGVVDELAAVTA